MRELVFEVTEELEGGFSAEAMGENIFTQGEDWSDLNEMALDATQAHFFDTPERKPTSIRLVLKQAANLQ